MSKQNKYSAMSVRSGIINYMGTRKTPPTIDQIVAKTGYNRKSVVNRYAEIRREMGIVL